MQVLLVNPPAPFLLDRRAMPPLGLLYLGSALEDEGIEVRVCDLNLGQELTGHDPKLIGVSCVTALYHKTRLVIQACREAYPGVPVIVGGPHISARPKDVSDLGADFGFTGDGEHAVVWAAKRVQAGQALPTRCDAMQAPPVDPDCCPFPARRLVPMEAYTYHFLGQRATTMVTQRGCPYACAFCCRLPGERKVRARRVSNVVAEVSSLKAIGFRSISFQDDELNLVGDRLLELCAELAGLGMSFRCNVRSDLFTERQASAMAVAGFKEVCVGVESGSARILSGIEKGTTPTTNARCRSICREHGIRFKAFVIVGLPGETAETIEETRRWLVENQVDEVGVYIFQPLPGSPIAENSESYDIDLGQLSEGYWRHANNDCGSYATTPWRRPDSVCATSGLTQARIVMAATWLDAAVRWELGLPPKGAQ